MQQIQFSTSPDTLPRGLSLRPPRFYIHQIIKAVKEHSAAVVTDWSLTVQIFLWRQSRSGGKNTLQLQEATRLSECEASNQRSSTTQKENINYISCNVHKNISVKAWDHPAEAAKCWNVTRKNLNSTYQGRCHWKFQSYFTDNNMLYIENGSESEANVEAA